MCVIFLIMQSVVLTCFYQSELCMLRFIRFIFTLKSAISQICTTNFVHIKSRCDEVLTVIYNCLWYSFLSFTITDVENRTT